MTSRDITGGVDLESSPPMLAMGVKAVAGIRACGKDHENDDGSTLTSSPSPPLSKPDKNCEEAAEYLRKCESEGIPAELADSAREACEEAREKWWDRYDAIQREWVESRQNEESKFVRNPRLPVPKPGPMPSWANPSAIAYMRRSAKSSALKHLRQSGGDTANPRFFSALSTLSSIYHGSSCDARDANSVRADCDTLALDGEWMILSKPSFPGCLGTNSKGQYMYTLGRMSFDMFRPIGLKCSIRSVRTEIEIVSNREDMPDSVPRSLRKEVDLLLTEKKSSALPTLRAYNTLVEFTIEPREEWDENHAPGPSRPLSAVMTTEGYMLPDPNVPNRLTVWFTGGELAPRVSNGMTSQKTPQQMTSLTRAQVTGLPAPNQSACALTLHDCRRRRSGEICLLHGVGTRKKPLGLPSSTSIQWEDIFGPEDNWKRTVGEKARALAAKMFLGAELPDCMEEDGTMRYALHRPIGGHGSGFLDVLYHDADLFVTRGNSGTIFVQTKYSSNLVKKISSPTPQMMPRREKSNAAANKCRADNIKKALAA